MSLFNFHEWKAYHKVAWQQVPSPLPGAHGPIRKPVIGDKIMGFFKPRSSDDVIVSQRQGIKETGEFACRADADVKDTDMLWRPSATQDGEGDYIVLRGNARIMPPGALTPIKVWLRAEVVEGVDKK